MASLIPATLVTAALLGVYFRSELVAFASRHLNLPDIADLDAKVAMWSSAHDEIPQLKPYMDGGRYPAAHSVADRIFTVPTHPFVSEYDRRAIAACLQTADRPVRPAA